MKTFRKSVTAIVGAAVALATTALGSTMASAAPTPAGGDLPQGKHCRTKIAKLEPGQTVSRVISRSCSDTPADIRPSGTSATLLMILYRDADWRGYSDVIESDDGPCDFFGYGWGRLANGVSSFKVYNNCNKTRAFADPNFTGYEETFYGNVAYVGDALNDTISSIKLTGPA